MTDGAIGAAAPTAERSPSTAPAHVEDHEIPELLLSLDEIRNIMGAPHMDIEKTVTQPAGFEGASFTPVECVGATFSAMAITYEGSGLRAFIDQETDEHEPATLEHGVELAVASFDDVTAAQALVVKSADQWRKCDGAQFISVFADGHKRPMWRFGQTNDSGGIITLSRHTEGVAFWDCTHVMATKANIVVDNLVCGYDLADRPATITSAILAKIPD